MTCRCCPPNGTPYYMSQQIEGRLITGWWYSDGVAAIGPFATAGAAVQDADRRDKEELEQAKEQADADEERP